MRCVRDLGEFGLIERLARIIPTSPSVIEGIGDDCAVLRVSDRFLLVSCDLCIENVHFKREHVTARDIGWKAAASALSDIAAMGGTPLYSLTSIACPGEEGAAFVEELYRGMMSVFSRFGTVIVGGDTTRSSDGVTIDIMVLGETVGGRYLRRRGAKVGDHVLVTGQLGLSAAGLHALSHDESEAELIRAHMCPHPRVVEGQWLCAHSPVHSMLDVSDGLCQDVGRLAKAARLGVDLHPERLPVAPALAGYCAKHGLDPLQLMLTGGEDYELAFTIDAKEADRTIEEFHHEFRAETTAIGVITDEWTGVRINGEEPDLPGFDHFKRIR